MKIIRTAALVLTLAAVTPPVFAQAQAAPAAHAPARHVGGKVTIVNGNAITVVSPKDPNPVSFTLTPRTKVIALAHATQSDLVLSQPVRIQGPVSATGTSIQARYILALAPATRRPGKMGRENSHMVVGEISSLSPLQVAVGSNPVVTVSVSTGTNTRVMKVTNGAASDIAVGSHVQAVLYGPASDSLARQVIVLPAPPKKGRNTF